MICISYEQFKNAMKPVDVGSSTHKLLQQYITNTHGTTHSTYKLELMQAFEVSREGEDEAFKDCGNRKLLWHGSRLTNWVGILSGGLRIAPPEAPVTGYMFGKVRRASGEWSSLSRATPESLAKRHTGKRAALSHGL